MPNIKNRDALLSAALYQVRRLDSTTPIGNVTLTLQVGDQKYEFSLYKGLEALVDDLYWDERGNWSDAERVFIDTL